MARITLSITELLQDLLLVLQGLVIVLPLVLSSLHLLVPWGERVHHDDDLWGEPSAEENAANRHPPMTSRYIIHCTSPYGSAGRVKGQFVNTTTHLDEGSQLTSHQPGWGDVEFLIYLIEGDDTVMSIVWRVSRAQSTRGNDQRVRSSSSGLTQAEESSWKHRILFRASYFGILT